MAIETAKEYVEQYFSEEQKSIFNFIVSAFPEKLLLIDSSIHVSDTSNDNNDVLTLCALLAYVIGDSREIIKNLSISKSLLELYNSINPDHEDYNEDLLENNKKLLLLLAEQLKSSVLEDSMTVDEKLAAVVENEESIKDSYQLVRNRGTEATIRQIIDAFLISEGLSGITYDIITDEAPRIDIVLLSPTGLVDYDRSSGVTYGDSLLYGIYKDTDLYKRLMAVRPAGFTYNVSVPIGLSTLSSNKVIQDSANLKTTVILKENIPEPEFILVESSQELGTYTAYITNNSELLNLTAYVYEGTGPQAEYTVLAGETKQIIKQAFGSSAYAYFKSGIYVSTIAEIPDLGLIPTPQLVFSSSNLTVSKGIAWGSGRAQLKIYNGNDRNARAYITLEWFETGTANKTSEKSASINVDGYSTTPTNAWIGFMNPETFDQDAKFTVYLKDIEGPEPYYIDSDEATNTITEVRRSTI